MFALAVNPQDGGVWGATEGGLFRYKNSRWTYFTRADGLPSDQANALAFSPDGTLYFGTQCDGIAIASPADNYKSWRVVPGPSQMPSAASGDGLPSALINCLLVTANGTVYVGTDRGLAASRDEGLTWRYQRGADWKAKLAGLSHPVVPSAAPFAGDLLSEDYVTSLAEGADDRLFVGHRQTGVEVFDPKTGKRVQSGANGISASDYVNCLLTEGANAWVGLYGGGLHPPIDAPAETNSSASAPAASFPVPAKPPTLAELSAMLTQVQSHKGDLPVGGAAYLGEDWQTEGDAIGHYGRQYAVLCAMNHVITCTNKYNVQGIMGDNHAPNDGLRWWVTWMQTDTPRSLYTPVAGVRRQAEWDDHGEAYPMTHEGPDIWVYVHLGEGDRHRVSLYFMNKDGHDWNNRYRDYTIEIKPFRGTVAASDAAPTLAHARVRDFWDGVYKNFVLSSPGDYAIKIAKNGSLNTILSGVLIDKVVGAQTVEDTEALAYTNGVHYDPPAAGAVPPTAAVALWKSLDAYGDMQAQQADRLLAYRALASSEVASSEPALSLLADWRWTLGLWTAQDRMGFDAAMAHAREAGVKLAHARTPAEFMSASKSGIVPADAPIAWLASAYPAAQVGMVQNVTGGGTWAFSYVNPQVSWSANLAKGTIGHIIGYGLSGWSSAEIAPASVDTTDNSTYPRPYGPLVSISQSWTGTDGPRIGKPTQGFSALVAADNTTVLGKVFYSLQQLSINASFSDWCCIVNGAVTFPATAGWSINVAGTPPTAGSSTPLGSVVSGSGGGSPILSGYDTNQYVNDALGINPPVISPSSVVTMFFTKPN